MNRPFSRKGFNSLFLFLVFVLYGNVFAGPPGEEQTPSNPPSIPELVEQIKQEAAKINYPDLPKKKLILIMTDVQLGHNLVFMPPIMASAQKSFPDYEIHYFGAASKVMIHNPVQGIYVHSLEDARSFIDQREPEDLVRFFIRQGAFVVGGEAVRLKEIAVEFHKTQDPNIKTYDHTEFMRDAFWGYFLEEKSLKPMQWAPSVLGLKVAGNSYKYISEDLPGFTQLPTDQEVRNLLLFPENIITSLESIRFQLFSQLTYPKWEFELMNFHGLSQESQLEDNSHFNAMIQKIIEKRLSNNPQLNLVFAPFEGIGHTIGVGALKNLHQKFPGRILDLSSVNYPFIVSSPNIRVPPADEGSG